MSNISRKGIAMKNRNKILLYALSLLMISLISFNESFINAESNKTIINFVDEDGNPLDIEDTVTIVKLEDQGGTKAPVSVYIKDGKETTDYDKGTPLNELEITDGKLEVEGLTKDNEYLISFDNDYVFQKEGDEETNYFLFGSFKGGSETYINSTDLKSVDELTFEQLEEIAGNKEIMELATGRITVTVSCKYANTFKVSEVDGSHGAVSCSNGGKSAICITTATAAGGSYEIRATCNGYVNNFTWNTITSSKSYDCTACGYGVSDPVCEKNATKTVTCSSSGSATQYYDANGGSCDKGSDTRTKAATYRTDSCNSNGTNWNYGSCGSSSWQGSVSAPSCSKGDTTDYATVYYNGNKGSGSTNVTLSKSSDSISRAVHYNFDGFSNFQTAFTSDTTAYAQYSVSGKDSYPDVILPTAYRDGYTFTGWSADGNTYNAGDEINSGGPKTYTATWSPNSYEYIIEFRSSTGKLLDTRTETHKFDETVTISHDPIPGYEVSDRQVNWNVAQDGHVVTITYQIITYNIEYSLEIGNRYPSGNPTINPNASTTTYNVESKSITFSNPTRTGYTFIGWFTEEGFINEKPTIPSGSVGNVKVYAKFEANSYPLSVSNTND